MAKGKGNVLAVQAPGLAQGSGLRGWIAGWLFGEHIRAVQRLRQENLRLQADLAKVQDLGRDELLQLRSLLGAQLNEQTAQLDTQRKSLKSLEENLNAQRSDLGALRKQGENQADHLQKQLDEYGRLIREQNGVMTSSLQQMNASLQRQLDEYSRLMRAQGESISHTTQLQLDEYGRLMREQSEALNFAMQQQAGSLQQQLDEYGRLMREQDERWFTNQEQMLAIHQDHAGRAAAMQQEYAAARQQAVATQQQLDAAAGRFQRLHLELSALDKTRGEATAAVLRQFQALQQQHERWLADQHDPLGPDFDYTAFEDRFRGDEKVIRERQSIYLPLLQSRPRVLDLGCGRGEMLELLRDAKVDAQGVELNPEQVVRCRGKGLDVIAGDFMSWLPGQPDGSYGAVTALQVVEHLSLGTLRQLIREAERVLAPDGILLFETVNPHCPEALEWFYIDPTHQRPVYPEMLQLLLEQAGFTGLEVRFQVPCSTAPQDAPATASTGADFAIWGFKR